MRRSERALRSRNQQPDQFVSVVSHDLRNPLNVAGGHLELAREECSSEHLAAVADAHDRMYTLVEDLLRLVHSGQEADGLESVEACRRHVTTAAATLVSEVDRRIRADRGRVQQLLEPLVRNAVEHGDNDVTVTVGALDAGFYVEDDGPGIPDDEREDVFEAGHSTTEDGTGFGPSIVEQVARAHGWDVDLTDSAGGGTRFEITGIEFGPAWGRAGRFVGTDATGAHLRAADRSTREESSTQPSSLSSPGPTASLRSPPHPTDGPYRAVEAGHGSAELDSRIQRTDTVDRGVSRYDRNPPRTVVTRRCPGSPTRPPPARPCPR